MISTGWVRVYKMEQNKYKSENCNGTLPVK